MNRQGTAAGQGRVWLVGAGPGSPDLLTIRAVRALAQADLLLYDALVAKETLDVAPNAQRFCVGKRGGRPSMDQETIHRLMIRGARRGKRVVRLKGGDPFVFGRGARKRWPSRRRGSPARWCPGCRVPWPPPPSPASRSPTAASRPPSSWCRATPSRPTVPCSSPWPRCP